MQLKPLTEVMTLQRGYDLPTSKRNGGDVPVIGATGVVGWHDDPKVDGPVVTIGRSGVVGGSYWSKTAAWPLNTSMYVKDFKGNNPRFIYYALKTIDFNSYDSGSAQPSLNRNYIAQIQFPCPLREEQDRIAEILGSLDDKIEANNALIDSLEQLVDLQVAQARENSGELVAIADLAVQMKVQTLPSKETSDKVLHYSLPAFDAGRVAVEEPADSILSNKFVVNKPAVLFSKLNPGTPRIWMIEPDADRLNVASTEFVVLEPRPGVDVGSLWAVCRDSRISQILVEYARGTSSSHQRVSPKDILSARVVDVRVPEAHTKLIRDLIAENVTLAKTRDLLIRKLIK